MNIKIVCRMSYVYTGNNNKATNGKRSNKLFKI